MRACPLVGLIRSVNIFRAVVFPAPLGPRKPTHFVPSIFRFRSERAVNAPYCLVKLTASIDGTFCCLQKAVVK